jgi:molybdopterin converting factor small subunit
LKIVQEFNRDHNDIREITDRAVKVEVKLFANFREYLPPGSVTYSCWLEMEEGNTIGQALERLKIPLSIPMIALVNGLHRTFEDRLQPGDVLSIFPPVAGG